MADWRMARSLDQLLAQINNLAPHRSKASDGGIGDQSHASRDSDHNPHRFSWTDKKLVTARDFTNDPSGGLDCQKLYRALVDAQDQRIKYVIWRRKITSGHGGPSPWVPRNYAGVNAHEKHLHLSVVADARADSAIPWGLRLTIPATPVVKPTPHKRWPELSRGDRQPEVGVIQRFLGIEDDNIFGEDTESAVKRYQRIRAIPVTGVVDATTWKQTGL